MGKFRTSRTSFRTPEGHKLHKSQKYVVGVKFKSGNEYHSSFSNKKKADAYKKQVSKKYGKKLESMTSFKKSHQK